MSDKSRGSIYSGSNPLNDARDRNILKRSTSKAGKIIVSQSLTRVGPAESRTALQSLNGTKRTRSPHMPNNNLTRTLEPNEDDMVDIPVFKKRETGLSGRK